jgi:nitrite reductase/ring-hydroxylating ferredoxin subunit
MTVTTQEPAGAVRFGTLDELRADARLTGKVGSIPVLVVWHDDAPYAIEDRCPHLGFPLHQGTVEAGLLTCHWHHARFDLASGCTLDPWADDAISFDVVIDGADVLVAPRPQAPALERWERRLRDGLEHSITLVIAKAVHAMLELPGGEQRILQIGFEFGERNRAEGWGSGLTVLTCIANLLPHLEPADRPLALVHALRFVARDVAGQPPRFAVGALTSAGQPIERLAGWYRRMVETRNADGAERTVSTALALGHLPEAEEMMVAAVTDHVFVDGGHVLDFTNKGFEALTHVGADGAPLLASLVRQACVADRAEEGSEWNYPHDLARLVRETEPALVDSLRGGTGLPGGDEEVAKLGWSLLADDPDSVAGTLVDAAARGATAEEVARAVAYAAALRLVRFHLNNDPADWDTVHHTFTFANAVHQTVVRRPTDEAVRGIVHAALTVYLDRFLNVPAARPPQPGPAEGALDDLAAAWDVQGGVDAAGSAVYRYMTAGGSRATICAALGRALLQEDAGFHWYQDVEAGVRQALAWPEGSEESALVLTGVARFLSSQTPTRRELPIIVRTAVRLRRGEELFADEPEAVAVEGP